MKKITEQVIIGERGVTLIGRYVLEMGHAWNPTTIDAGIDGRIELRRQETSEALNLIILVQSKATTQRFPAETQGSFEWPCEPRDIEYWMQGNAPVILVVSRFKDGQEEAYWINIKEYFLDPARRKRGKVQFDKKRDRFDGTCGEALFHVAAPGANGIYLGPPPVVETLYSNLLPVSWLPATVYTAQTEIGNTGAFWARMKESNKEPPGGEFVIRGKQILSFRDLDHPAFKLVCDVGTIEEHQTSHWSESNEPELRRNFVELLNRSLSAKVRRDGIRFENYGRYYHFMATRDLRAREFGYVSRRVKTSREVFGPHRSKKDPSRVAYYRHSAFEGSFRRYSDRWFLEITPTYRFTSDGRSPHPFAESYLKGIKELENNDAVAGQVIMWAALLTRDAELFVKEEFIRFDPLVTFQLDVGIPESYWLERPNQQSSANEEQLEVPQLALDL